MKKAKRDMMVGVGGVLSSSPTELLTEVVLT